jgi:hypothetical protein
MTSFFINVVKRRKNLHFCSKIKMNRAIHPLWEGYFLG